MKAKNRDRLLIEVLVTMRTAKTDQDKYTLMNLGTSLVQEYRDLNKDEVEKKIKAISGN